MNYILYGQLISNAKHIFRIMKITVVALFASVISLYATEVSSQNTKISIRADQLSTKEIIAKIEKQTDYLFVYNKNEVDVTKIVSLNVDNEPVSAVLNKIFANTNISYKLMGKNISLVINQDGNLEVKQQKVKTITGVVLDQSGLPIIGANIVEKGTTNGTITDMDGRYSLSVTEGSILQVTYIGYYSQDVKVGVEQTLKIVMKEDTKALDEVIVVGYGTQKKINVTGAIATVYASELSTLSVSNVGQALQGRVAGLQINSNSGAPGAGSGIVLRGLGSFKAATAPLVLIDGVEASIDMISTKDVESISVLKDASATSIYGTRAANGVILITTKKGGKGTLDINLSVDYGMLNPSMELPKPLKAHDMAMLQNEASLNKGGNVVWNEKQLASLDKGTNWLEEGIVSGRRFNPHLSVRGGTDRFGFNAALDYLDEKGIVYNSAYKRLSAMINLDATFSKYFKWGWNTRFVNKIYSNGGADLNNLAKFPSWIAKTNPDGTPGSYNLDPTVHPSQVRPDMINPLFRSDLDKRELSNPNYTIISSMFGELSIGDFKLRSTISGNLYYAFEKKFSPAYIYYDATGKEGNKVIDELSTDRSTLEQKSYHNFEWRIINQLSYNKQIKDHTIGIMLGHDELQVKKQNFTASRRGFANQDIIVLNLGTDNDMARGELSNYAMRSFFGRINYDYKGRYLFEASVRHDGSTAFSPENRWGTFPGASVGWRVSEEKFFPKYNWLDNLKIRLSYGLTGNAPTGFEWLSLLNSGKSYATTGNPNSASGGILQPGMTLPETSLFSPNIKWEESKTVNLGLDLNLFNKLLITAEVYEKKTNDLLFPLQVSSISGVFNGDNPGTQLTNFAAINNKGVELLVQYQDRIGEVDFSTSFTFSRNINEITKINQNNESIGSYTIQKVGHPINSLYGYITDGELYKSEEQIKSTPSLSDAKVGSFIYKDISGPQGNPDGKIDQFDKTIIGNPNPDGVFGLNLYAKWKDFDFSVFAQGELGKDFFNAGPDLTGFNNFEAISWNNFEQVLNRYHPVNNPQGNRPSVGSVGNNPPSTFHVDNVSYLRLRNIEIGYNLSKSVLKNVGLKSVRIYSNVRNLFTITSSKNGFDPERGNDAYSPYAVFPQARVINFGVNVMF